MIKRFRAMTWRQRAAAALIGIATLATAWGLQKLFVAMATQNANSITDAARSGYGLGLVASVLAYPLIANWARAAYRRLGGGGRTQTAK